MSHIPSKAMHHAHVEPALKPAAPPPESGVIATLRKVPVAAWVGSALVGGAAAIGLVTLTSSSSPKASSRKRSTTRKPRAKRADASA